MDETIWTALHDGSIVDIENAPPGDVRITVETSELRKMWDEAGTSLVVYLEACDTLAWNSYDTPAEETTDNIAFIADQHPFILQTTYDEEQDLLIVATESGDLILRYALATITLDTGTPVTPEELKHKSDLFWGNY